MEENNEIIKPKAMYLHGLGSGGNSITGKNLAKKFKKYDWITPEVGEKFSEELYKLQQIVDNEHPELIIGSSYGGLYTMYLKTDNAVKIVHNPACYAEDLFKDDIGLGMHPYFIERSDGKTEFELTQEICDDIREYKRDNLPQTGKKGFSIIAVNDDLFGTDGAFKNAAFSKQCGFEIIYDDKSKHRISNDTMRIIKQIINNL